MIYIIYFTNVSVLIINNFKILKAKIINLSMNQF